MYRCKCKRSIYFSRVNLSSTYRVGCFVFLPTMPFLVDRVSSLREESSAMQRRFNALVCPAVAPTSPLLRRWSSHSYDGCSHGASEKRSSCAVIYLFTFFTANLDRYKRACYNDVLRHQCVTR